MQASIKRKIRSQLRLIDSSSKLPMDFLGDVGYILQIEITCGCQLLSLTTVCRGTLLRSFDVALESLRPFMTYSFSIMAT